MAERSYSSRFWSAVVQKVMRRAPSALALPCLPPELVAILPSDAVIEILARLPSTLLSQLSVYHLHLSNSIVRVYEFNASFQFNATTYRLRLRRVLKRFVRLTEISFIDCVNVDDNVMIEFRQTFKNVRLQECRLQECRLGYKNVGLGSVEMGGLHLTKISLAGCVGISPLGFQHVAMGCSCLTSLDASSTLINDDALQVFGDVSTPLESVRLFACQAISDHGLHHLLAGCPTIMHIDVSHSLDVKGYGFKHARALKTIALDCCNIDIFDGITAMLTSPSVVDISMKSIVAYRGDQVGYQAGYAVIRSETLISLDISNCGCMLDRSSIIHITEGCPQLEVLVISRCMPQLHGCAVYLATCPYLRVLDISGIAVTDADMDLLRTGCHSLRELICTGCGVSDAAYRAFMIERQNVRLVDEGEEELQFDLDLDL